MLDDIVYRLGQPQRKLAVLPGIEMQGQDPDQEKTADERGDLVDNDPTAFFRQPQITG